jgi:hypothetical protein
MMQGASARGDESLKVASRIFVYIVARFRSVIATSRVDSLGVG